MEVEVLHKDGHTLPVEIHAVLIFDDQGIPVEILGVARDITVRKRAERALADSEKRLSDIIEFLPDPTWVIDTDGRVIAWNQAIERTTGIQKEEILGQGDYAYTFTDMKRWIIPAYPPPHFRMMKWWRPPML